MVSQSLLVLASIIGYTAATGVLLPLYVYPSLDFGDGAALWQPALSAISSSPNVPWLVVVNPHNGPGLSGQPGDADPNYISGVSQLNAHSNVKTIGYVRTNFAASPIAEVEANITIWKSWGTYTAADISVDGIFFDETSTSDFNYLSTVISFARNAFGSKAITTICNFGVKADVQFYSICDVVIAFESCLNCKDSSGAQLPQYKSQTTITSNIPSGKQSQGAILVHDFVGTAADGSAASTALLQQYTHTLALNGVGWCYFGSAGYSSITTPPATVGALAAAVASG
ncbi:putative cell surface spherulin 4-like protein [Favolaschia claudopus]|uniref:Cell surface spherulin 4-like protein n=1 Tax=Favolaschia claudopus TaxID=2862362 RepID=A0AAW0E186_9AGAR